MSTINYKGFEITIEECDRENPREDYNVTSIYCFHKRYYIGDEHDHSSDEFDSWDEFKQHLIDKHDAFVVKPLYMYEHSGMTINTTGFSCNWDSGQVGWVFVTKKEAEANGWDEKRCEDVIVEDVAYYDRYVSGEPAYRFNVSGPDLDDDCGGFDSEDDAIESAKGTIDAFLHHLEGAGITAESKYKEACRELDTAIEELEAAIARHAAAHDESKGNWADVADIENLTHEILRATSLIKKDEEE